MTSVTSQLIPLQFKFESETTFEDNNLSSFFSEIFSPEETKEIEPLSEANFSSLTSFPSRLTEPCRGSWKRRRRPTRVVFPDPVLPTSPMVWPASILRETPSRTDSLSG